MEYSYEIVRVDADFRVMDVIYTHAAHGNFRVGVRLPFEDEDLEVLIKSFAPVGHWKSLEKAVVVPDVGMTGVIRQEEQVAVLEENEVVL